MRTLLLTTFTPAGSGTVTSLHRGRAQTGTASATRSSAPGMPPLPGTPTSPARTTAATASPQRARRRRGAGLDHGWTPTCASSFPMQRDEGAHHPQTPDFGKPLLGGCRVDDSTRTSVALT